MKKGAEKEREKEDEGFYFCSKPDCVKFFCSKSDCVKFFFVPNLIL